MEEIFKGDWVKDKFARCFCGMTLYKEPDDTQEKYCNLCNLGFDSRQAYWAHELNLLKKRVNGLATHGSASSASVFAGPALKVPSMVNGLATNVSCKIIFEQEVYVAYAKDTAPFKSAEGTIGSIEKQECYLKYVSIYETKDRSGKMTMNKALRDCMQDPEHIVNALIQLFNAPIST